MTDDLTRRSQWERFLVASPGSQEEADAHAKLHASHEFSEYLDPLDAEYLGE